MRLLLDTQIVLRHLQGSRTVRGEARAAIERASELAFSVVSFAEIGVKAAIGKLTVPADLHDQVLRSGLSIVGLAPAHGLLVGDLPLHHRDPFDRLLIAQARCEGLTIVTADRRFADYDVRVIAAV